MRDSIYNVFKIALEAYLTRDGKCFLETELINLVEHMLRTATVTLDGKDVCLTTNNALIQLDCSELRAERELPRLFLFRESNMFRTFDAQMITDKQFTLHSTTSISDVEDYILGYSSDVVVLVDNQAVDYSVFDYEDELNEEDTETRYIVFDREAFSLAAVKGFDDSINEGYKSKRYLVERIKKLYDEGFSGFKAFSLLDNTPLYFKLCSLVYDSLSSYTTGTLGLVFTDESGCRMFDRADDGDSFLPF